MLIYKKYIDILVLNNFLIKDEDKFTYILPIL